MNKRELKNFTNNLTMKQVEAWMAKVGLKDCRYVYLWEESGKNFIRFYDSHNRYVRFEGKDRCFDADLREYVREYNPLKVNRSGKLLPKTDLVAVLLECDEYCYVKPENLYLFEQCPICGRWRVISRKVSRVYLVDNKQYCEHCFNDAKNKRTVVYCEICHKYHLAENTLTYEVKHQQRFACVDCIDKAIADGTIKYDYYTGELFDDSYGLTDGYGNPVSYSTYYDELVIASDGLRYYVTDLCSVFGANGYKALVLKSSLTPENYVEIDGAYYDKSLIVEMYGEKMCLVANKLRIYGYHSWDGRREFHSLNDEKTEMYFGTEIETCGNTVNSAAIKLCNTDDLFHCERDGSLPSESFEMISQPMTWNYLKSRYEDLKKTFKMLIDLNQRSDETSCCGLHVHVSRKAFKNEEAIKRAVAIITYFQKNNEVIARRKSNSYYRYQYIGGIITKEKVHCQSGHDTAVNCGNDYSDKNTIEFRIFKGTLNINTYFATIEFVKNVVEMANSDVKRFAYSELLKGEYLPAYVQNRLDKGYAIDLDKVIDLQGWNNNETKAHLKEKWKIVQMLKEYNSKHPENRICNHTLRVGGAL